MFFLDVLAASALIFYIIVSLALIFCLVTTNHWTKGKKFIVALGFSIAWQQIILALYKFSLLSICLNLTLAFASAPLTIVMLMIVYNYYLE